MRAKHYITLAAAVILLVILYLGGNTVPPKKEAKEAMQRPSSAGAVSQGPATVRPLSLDSIMSLSRARLTQAVADSIKAYEKDLSAIRDSSRMADVFKQLSGVWERAGVYPPAVYYRSKVAKLENSEKSLTFAGQLFLELLEHEENRPIQLWEAGEAIGCLEQALALNPEAEEAKLALASAYIQGTGEPMKGVQMLLAITREKPGDIPANMLLGRMSIQSGQFEKAVKRFETVLKQEPENKEALYFLAQAYEGSGDKAKAVEMLEKCKILVNNPEFSREIDQHINSLK